MLLHKGLFASKWMQAMHFALGDTFAGDSSFALLYVMYNPICRNDMLRRKGIANKMLAEALYLVELEYLGQTKRLGYYVKSSWVALKFAIKNRALADCNPTIVLSASQQSHATIFKVLNRLFMLVQNNERDAKTNWTTARSKVMSKITAAKTLRYMKNLRPNSLMADPKCVIPASKSTQSSVTWFQQIKNFWKKSNRVVPSGSENEQRSEDAPKMFVDEFALKRAFVEDNIQDEARLSLLTLLIFPDPEDFGSSTDCKCFKQQFDENMAAFRRMLQSLFRLSKDLEYADFSEKRAALNGTERFFLSVSNMLFGDEMKLLRNFHLLADEEAIDWFQRYKFPELEGDCKSAPSEDKVLKQLFAVNEEKIFPESDTSSQVQAFPLNTPLDHASLIEPPPELHSSTVHVHETNTIFTAEFPLPPGLPRVRPSMYSTKQILAATKKSTILSDVQPSDFMRDSSSEVTSLIAVPIITQSEPLSATQAYQCAIVAQVKDLPAGVLEMSQACDAMQHDSIANFELSRARAENASLIEQIKNLQSALHMESSTALAAKAEAHRSASEVEKLAAQVQDLQLALHAVESQLHNFSTKQTATEESVDSELQMKEFQAELQNPISAGSLQQDMSADVAAMCEELLSAQAVSAAAIKRAINAEKEIKDLRDELRNFRAEANSVNSSASIAAMLSLEVKDLQTALQTETEWQNSSLAQSKTDDSLMSPMQEKAQAAILEAVQRAVDAEAITSNLQAQLSTAKQRVFLMEAELRALRDELSVASVAVQPAAASDADADADEDVNATRSAAVVATLSSQVKHLQDALAAASRVSAQVEDSKSSEVAVLSAELTRARAEISDAVQRAVNAESELRALRDELSVASIAVQPAAASDADADADEEANRSAAVVETLSPSIPSSQLSEDSECIQSFTVVRVAGHSSVDIDAVGYQYGAGEVKYSDDKNAKQAPSTVSERSAAATKTAAEIKAAQIALLGLDHIEHQWKKLAAAREEISQARGLRPAAAGAAARRSRPSTAGASAAKDSMKANPASVRYSSVSNADMNAQSVGIEVAPPRSRSPTRPSSSPSYMTAAPMTPLRSQLPSSRAKYGDGEVSPSFKEVLYRFLNRYVCVRCLSLKASRVSLTHALLL
jgi:hypothetical protein